MSPVAEPSGDSVPVVEAVVDAIQSEVNLPRTGAELLQQAALGLILLGGGLVLLAVRRRRSSSQAA